MYLKEGTYHTRLFRGPGTNGMKKSGMVLAAPGPLLTPPPSSSPPKTLTGPTPPKLDPRMKRRTPPPNRTCPRRQELDIDEHTDPMCQHSCGVTPLPQRALHPTDHVRQETETNPTYNPPQSARKNVAGETRRLRFRVQGLVRYCSNKHTLAATQPGGPRGCVYYCGAYNKAVRVGAG